MTMRLFLAAGLLSCCAPIAGHPIGDGERFELHRFDDDMQSRWRFTSHLTRPARTAIRNEAEWEEFWEALTSTQSYAPPQPVDFAREMILVAAMGARRSGGYRIEILSAVDDGREIVVRVLETSPGPRCGTIQAVTEPADIVRVTRSNKPVRWLEERRVADCR